MQCYEWFLLSSSVVFLVRIMRVLCVKEAFQVRDIEAAQLSGGKHSLY